MGFQFVSDYKLSGQYWSVKDILVVYDPDWVEEGDPFAQWEIYWQIVAHETAHKIQVEWFGRKAVGHDDIFYAILMAVCGVWDIHMANFERGEDWYHPRSLQAGKQTGGILLLQMIKNLADGKVQEGPLFTDEESSPEPSVDSSEASVAE